MSEQSSGAEGETQVHYADNDVLTPEQVRLALRLSQRTWTRVAPKLPVSYLCGPQLPRYVYGEVIEALRKSGAAA